MEAQSVLVTLLKVTKLEANGSSGALCLVSLPFFHPIVWNCGGA